MNGPRSDRRRIACLLAAALFLSAACSPREAADVAAAPDLQALNQSLIEADQAFNRATQEFGAAGWVSFFDDEGTMIREGVGEISGLDAIAWEMDAVFSSPGASLTWEPRWAQASDDGTLGFTVGDYEATSVDAGGQSVLSHGLYVSIWRRQPDGSWKVLMDLGNPTD